MTLWDVQDWAEEQRMAGRDVAGIYLSQQRFNELRMEVARLRAWDTSKMDTAYPASIVINLPSGPFTISPKPYDKWVPEASKPNCPYRAHALDCDCQGMGGDR